MRRNRTDYAINRYYSPDTGRFTTHDPLTELDRPDRLNQPQGLNLYPYVMGAPTRYTDPDGLEWMHKDAELFWSESVGETDALRQTGWRSVKEGQIFHKSDDPGNTFYLADEWSSNPATAFLPITLPRASAYDFKLPNKMTGDLERFEGVPDHARFVEWTH